MQEVTKRNGTVVPFDDRKIASALQRCLASVGGDPEQAEHLTQMVTDVVDAKYQLPNVEQIQDVVESVLISVGLRAAARHYMAYRDEHAALRAASDVDPQVRAAFDESATMLNNDPLRMFQLIDKYARWNDDLGRRETWPETVYRAISYMREIVVDNCGRDMLTDGEWAELRAGLLAMDAMPSMRLIATAGPAARRDNVSIYNCAYQAFDDVSAIGESLSIAMTGCGDAYSVESRFVRQLPFVKYQRDAKRDVFVVPDTSEGWVEAVMFGAHRWFDGYDVDYDVSNLRPAGAILRTKGGQASGPGPLRYVLEHVRAVILSRQGSAIRPIDANDIMTITGEAGNSGGMRRTAKLSLSDWGDTEMRDAKSGAWYLNDQQPWRANANNSAAWPDGGPSALDLVEQMGSMFRARSGERGIFSRANALRTMPAKRAEFLRRTGAYLSIGTNPCGEIVLQSRQFCNLSQAVVRPHDDLESLRRKVRIATIFGTIQSMATYFPNLRPEWGENCRAERLLGVDLPGQMDNKIFNEASRGGAAWDYAAYVLRELRDEAVRVNAEWATRFGIEPSASTTCCKPGGNSSAFLDAAPGQGERKIRYGIRNARVNATSPIFRVLRACGVPMDPENGQVAETATKWVVHFPMRAPDGAVVASERSAIDQCEHWRLNKLNWTTHNPSCTITYSPDEMIDLIAWVWRNRDIIGGLSFLPKSDTIYKQLPYEETSREEYERAVAAFPRIDWSMITAFEREDHTTASQELACAAGACSIDDMLPPKIES